MIEKKHLEFKKIILYITSFFFIVFVSLFSFFTLIQSSYTKFTIADGQIGASLVYKNFSTIGSVLLFLLLVVFLIVINKYEDRLSSKTVLLIEMVVFFIIGFIFCVLYREVKPFVDSKDVYDAALKLYYGDYSAIESKSYIGQWPNNLGIFSICYLILTLIGDNLNALIVLRLINLVFSIIAYIYLYRITDILYHSNKINLFLLILFLGFNHFLLYSVFIYNNVIGYSLAIVSIYYLIVYIKNGKKLWLSFISIILSIIVRTNSLIILIAEIIVLIIHAIETRKLLNYIMVFIFIISLFSPKLITKYYENKYDVVYNHQFPLISYICFGINYHKGTPGAHINDFSDMHVEYGYEADPVEAYANMYLNDTLSYFASNPVRCIEFYIEKFICAWCDQNHDVFTNVFNEKILLEDYESFLNDIYDSYSSLMAIGLFAYAIIKRKKDDYDFILILSVVGGFLFHFFWEIKAIYCYQYILLLLPLSAKGLSLLFSRFCGSKDVINN